MAVVPLVCEECLDVVGVINNDAFEKMVEDRRVYVCRACSDTQHGIEIEAVFPEMEMWAATMRVERIRSDVAFHTLVQDVEVIVRRAEEGG